MTHEMPEMKPDLHQAGAQTSRSIAEVQRENEMMRKARLAEKDRCLEAVKPWLRPDHIRLHAGEMTAQEMRSAVAVARGIFSSIQDC